VIYDLRVDEPVSCREVERHRIVRAGTRPPLDIELRFIDGTSFRFDETRPDGTIGARGP
jgi:hypothetical protein